MNSFDPITTEELKSHYSPNRAWTFPSPFFKDSKEVKIFSIPGSKELITSVNDIYRHSLKIL